MESWKHEAKYRHSTHSGRKRFEGKCENTLRFLLSIFSKTMLLFRTINNASPYCLCHDVEKNLPVLFGKLQKIVEKPLMHSAQKVMRIFKKVTTC